MEIRNLMEDEVVRIIHRICDEEEQSGDFGYSTGQECRVDAVCYILNRTRPRYVSSARGMSHLAYESDHDTQAHIDLVNLAHEALRRITSFRREYYDSSDRTDGDDETPYLAMPIITGRLLSATSFAPLSDITVELRFRDSIVAMVDRRWDNPYSVSDNASGQYSFWPKIPEQESERDSDIEFCLAVQDERFEPFRHYFSVPPLSDTSGRTVSGLEAHHEHTIPDLYLIPEGPDENDERGYQ